MTFMLKVDGHTYYVDSTQQALRERSMQYTKEQIRAGRRLSEIEYCWTPICVQRRLP